MYRINLDLIIPKINLNNFKKEINGVETALNLKFKNYNLSLSPVSEEIKMSNPEVDYNARLCLDFSIEDAQITLFKNILNKLKTSYPNLQGDVRIQEEIKFE